MSYWIIDSHWAANFKTWHMVKVKLTQYRLVHNVWLQVLVVLSLLSALTSFKMSEGTGTVIGDAGAARGQQVTGAGFGEARDDVSRRRPSTLSNSPSPNGHFLVFAPQQLINSWTLSSAPVSRETSATSKASLCRTSCVTMCSVSFIVGNNGSKQQILNPADFDFGC